MNYLYLTQEEAKLFLMFFIQSARVHPDKNTFPNQQPGETLVYFAEGFDLFNSGKPFFCGVCRSDGEVIGVLNTDPEAQFFMLGREKEQSDE